MQTVLLTCPAGPPDNPKTWSGTPSRLLAALRSAGQIDPLPWAGALTQQRTRWLHRLDRGLGLGHRFIPGPAQRWGSGRAVSMATQEKNCAAVLHLGTYDVPLMDDGRLHYLYVDNSYDLWESHAREAQRLSAHQRRWFRRMEYRALKKIRHVFTVGRHVAENIISSAGIPAERVTAVGSGLGGIQAFHGPKNYRNGRLLIVAKVRPEEKGLPLLLDAFHLARRKRPELLLTVVGGAAIPALSEHANVVGTGWISAAELQSLFDQASLFVMPATYEPWGLAYLEALACRIPVIGLSRGALPEITDGGRFGFMLDDPDPVSLAELLDRALSDPEQLAKIGFEAQKNCLNHYRWERVAQTIGSIIAKDLTSPSIRHA